MRKEKIKVIESTDINGVYWIQNHYIKTSTHSRIVIPSPGQGLFSVVSHAFDFSDEDHGGYEVYGIHIGQNDVLSFMSLDERVIKGKFVDCRKGSPTIHQSIEIEFLGSPEKSLVIERGVAHIFDNLKGMVTLNQPQIYYDYKNNFYNSRSDVINVPRGTKENNFPAVEINKYLAPKWLCNFMLKRQRYLLSGNNNNNHPYIFQKGDEKLILTPPNIKR